MWNERFRYKAVLVTGGGSGIGQAAAVRFASEGAVVGVLDRDDGKIRETEVFIDGAQSLVR